MKFSTFFEVLVELFGITKINIATVYQGEIKQFTSCTTNIRFNTKYFDIVFLFEFESPSGGKTKCDNGAIWINMSNNALFI